MRTAWATQNSLMTGSMPGMAASTKDTWLFGSAPKPVEAPENSFDFDDTWAWISMPTTISQSPVAPATSFDSDAFAIGRGLSGRGGSGGGPPVGREFGLRR